MSIEIVALTNKGWALSKSVRHNNDSSWRVVYHLARMGGQSTLDRITTFCFGGDISSAKMAVGKLKRQDIVT